MIPILLQTDTGAAGVTEIVFPLSYTFYSFLLCLFILYHLLVDNHVRAAFFELALNKYFHWTGSEEEVKIGSLSFAIISGRLYLNNIEYRNRNYCLQALRATITINWARSQVRQMETKDDETLPCRLSVGMDGVQLILFNSSGAYEELSRMYDEKEERKDSKQPRPSCTSETPAAGRQKKSCSGNSTGDGEKVEAESESMDGVLPYLYRSYFPLTLVRLNSFAIMIGNDMLPYFFVLYCEKGTILHGAQASPSVNAGYQLVTEMSFRPRYPNKKSTRLPTAYLLKNPSFSLGEPSREIIQSGGRQDIVRSALYAFKNFIPDDNITVPVDSEKQDTESAATRSSERASPFPSESQPLDNNAVGEEPDGERKGRGENEHQKSVEKDTGAKTGAIDIENGVNGSDNVQGKDALRTRRRHCERLFECANFKITHVYDSPALLTSKQAKQLKERYQSRTRDAGYRAAPREEKGGLEERNGSSDNFYDFVEGSDALDICEKDNASHATEKEMESPVQSLIITFQSQVDIEYGPWMDCQRTLIQSYFLPSKYENQPLHVPREGDFWVHAVFQVKLVFLHKSQLVLPFRQLSVLDLQEFRASYDNDTRVGNDIQSGVHEDDKQKREHTKPGHIYCERMCAEETGWLKVDFDGGSVFEQNIQQWSTGDEGSHSKTKIDFKNATLTPSITGVPLVEPSAKDESHLKVEIDMHYPVIWNETFTSTYDIKIDPARVFYLADHIGFFQDLTRDWSTYATQRHHTWKFGGEGLDFFYPYESIYQIYLANYELFLNANENNVIDVINGIEENTHVVLRGPSLKVNLRVPYLNCHGRHADITYDVFTEDIRASLEFPELHPLSDLLESSMKEQELRMVYASSLKIDGRFLYHYTQDDGFRDLSSMDLKIKDVDFHCYGHYLRYWISVFNNYFGGNTCILSREAFVEQWSRKNLASYFNSVMHHIDAINSNSLNAYDSSISISAENLKITFPQNLFSTQPSVPKANCYELQVDIRSLQEYSEYLVKTSPITIDVPCPDEPNNTRRQRLASFPDAETWNINQSYLQLNEFSFCSMHQKGRLFTGFRGSNKIQIDEIRGQLLPSQALLLVSCFRNFVQQWADAQDFNIPECSTDSELEQSWKRRKVTRSNGKGRASSVHNKSSRHSNDTRTFIRQAPIDNSSSTPYTESDVNFVIEKYIESQRSSEMGDWKTELNVGVVRFNLLHPPPCVHRQPKDSETFGVPATSRASQSSTKVSSASNSHRHFSEQGARLGITQVLLYGGIQMKASSWITEDAVSRLVVTVPNITVEYLSRLSPTSSWFTLAHFETGVVCSNSVSRTDQEKLRDVQRDLIYGEAMQHRDHDSAYGVDSTWHKFNVRATPCASVDDMPFSVTNPLAVVDTKTGHPTFDHNSSSPSVTDFQQESFARSGASAGGGDYFHDSEDYSNAEDGSNDSFCFVYHPSMDADESVDQVTQTSRSRGSVEPIGFRPSPASDSSRQSLITSDSFSDLGSDEEDSFADSFASCIEHDNLDSAMRRVSFSRSSGMTSESDDLAEFHEAFEFTGVPAVETSIKDRKAKSMPLKLPPAYPLSASQSTVKQNKRTLTPSGDTTRTCRLNLRMSDDKSFSYFPTSKVAPHSHSFTSFHARGNVAHSRDLVYAVPTEFPTDSCLQSRRSERMSIGVGAKSPYACESGFSGSRTDAFAMLPFTTFVDNRDNAFSPTTFRNGLLPRKRASNASAFTNGRTAEETRVGVSLESVVNNQSHSIYHKPKQTKSTTAKKVGTPEIDGDTIGADDTKSLAGNRRLEKERRPISRQSTVIETTQPTCLSLTPTFLACLDDFVEFVQPSFSSLEDTLDEIHLQMSKVFKNSKISLYNDADYMKMPLACSSTSTSFFSAPHDGGSELIVDIPTVDLQFVQSFTLDSSSDEVLVSTTLKTQGLRVMKTKDIPIAPIGTPLVAFRDQPSKDTVVTLDSFLIFSHVAESYPVARQRNQEGCITLSSVHPETCQAILESHVDSNDCDGIFFIFHVQNSVLSTTEKVDVKPLQKARTRRKDAEAPDLSSQFSASRSRMPRAFVAAQPHSLVDHHGGFDGSGISRLLQHGFRAQIDDASLYVGSSAPSLVYAVIDDWALSVDKSEFVKGIRTMSQGPTEWLENMYGPQETNAFKHMSHNENHFNLTKLVGGPSSTSSRFRWQAALSFALQNYGTHVLHNHPNRRNKSRNPGRLFSSIDQMRLLMWFNARSPDSRVGKRLQDEGRRIKKAFKNSGRAGAKPKMQAPLTQEAVSNYVRSTCAPLTIALRKLLNLPEEIRSRLQFRLQQHEAPQMLNYQDIFHHSSARLSLSFEACAVRNFASIVSEACGLVPLKQKVAHIATGTYPGALVNILSSKAERKTGVHVFNFEWALRDLNIHLVEEKQHSLTGRFLAGKATLKTRHTQPTRIAKQQINSELLVASSASKLSLDIGTGIHAFLVSSASTWSRYASGNTALRAHRRNHPRSKLNIDEDGENGPQREINFAMDLLSDVTDKAVNSKFLPFLKVSSSGDSTHHSRELKRKSDEEHMKSIDLHMQLSVDEIEISAREPQSGGSVNLISSRASLALGSHPVKPSFPSSRHGSADSKTTATLERSSNRATAPSRSVKYVNFHSDDLKILLLKESSLATDSEPDMAPKKQGSVLCSAETRKLKLNLNMYSPSQPQLPVGKLTENMLPEDHIYCQKSSAVPLTPQTTVILDFDGFYFTLPLHDWASVEPSRFIDAWVRCVDVISIKNNDHSVQRNSGKSESRARYDTPDCTLQQEAQASISICARVKSLSFVIFPLPSVKLTYSIDRIWCSFNDSSHRCKDITISIGKDKKRKKKDKDHGGEMGVEENPISDEEEGVETVPHSFQLHHLNQKNYHCKKVSSSIASSSTSGVPSTQIEEDEGMDLVWELKLPVVRAAFGFRDVTVTDHEVTDAALVNEDAPKKEMVAAVGILTIGRMANHINEDILNRMLQYQSILDTEISQIIDKIKFRLRERSPPNTSESFTPVYNEYGRHTDGSSRTLSQKLSESMIQHGRSADSEHLPSENNRQPNNRSTDARNSGLEWTKDQMKLNLTLVVQEINMTADVSKISPLPRTDSLTSPYPSYSYSSHYSFYPYGTPLNPSASPILSLSSGEVRSTVVLNPTYSLDDRSKCKPLLKRVSLDTESEDLSFPGTDTEDLYFPGTLGNDVKGDDKKHAQDVSNSPLCVELSSEGFTIKTTIPIQGESINIFGRSQFSADRKHNTNAFRNHTLDVADLGGAPLVGDVRWEKVLCFESNVTTRVGTDLDWSNIKGGIFIKESSFRLLAVEATLSSLDVMSSHFQAAYESYVSERARLLRENEISDYIPDFKSNTDHILSQWGTMNLGDDLQGMAVSHNEPVSLSVPEKTIGVGRIKRRRKKKAKRKKKLGGTFQFSLRQARIIVMYANQTPHLFGSVKPKSCTPVERKMSVSENEDDGNNFDAVVCSLDRFGGQVAYLPMPAIDEGKYVLRYVQYYNQQQANGIEATFQADHFSLAFVSRVTDKETVDHICDRISEVSSASKVSHDVNHAFFPCLGVKMQINFKDESIVNDLSSRSAGRSYERVGSAITLSSSHPTAKFRMLTIDTDISAEGAQVHIDPHLVHYLRDIESFVSLCAGFDPPRAQTTSSSAGSTSSAASASSSSSVTSSNSLLAASTETQSQSNLASWNFDSASSSPSFPATKKEKKPWGVNLHLKLAQKSGSCHLHLRQGSDCIFGGGSASEREEGPSSGIASSKAVSHDLEHSSPLPVDAIAEVKARAFADRIGGKSRLLSKNERVGKLEEKIGKVQQKLEPEHLGLSTRKSWLSEKSSQKDASNQSTDLLQQKGQKEESGADDQSRRASSKWIGGDVIKFGLPSMKVGWFFDHTPSLNVYSHPMFDTNNVINLEISLPDLQLSPGVLIFIYQTQEEMAIRSVRALSEDCQLEITAVPSLFYPSAAPDTARVGTDENAKFPILVEHQQSVGNVEGQKGENNLTVTCRVCPTFLKLDCLPMDAGVSLVIKIEEPVIGCYSSSPLSVKGKSMAETRRYVCEALTLSSPHMTVSLNNSIVGSVTNGNMDPSLSSQFIIHGTKLHHVRTYADKTHSKSQSISNGVEDKRQSRFTGGKRLDFKTALFKIDSVLLDLDARSLQSMMVMDTCWNPTASEANLSSSAMIEVGVKSILRNKPISWTELEQSSSQSSKEGSIPTLQNTQSVRGDHAGEGGAQRWSSSPSRKEENSVIYLAFADKMKLNLHLNGVDNNVESLQTTELNRIFLKAVEIDCNNRIGLSPFMSLLTVDRLAMKLTPQHGGLAGNLELRNGIKVKAGRLRYSDEVDEAKSARSTGIIGSSAPTSQSQRKLTFHDCRSEKNLHNILDAEISSLYVNLYTEERQLLLLKTEDASSISIYDEKHRSGQRKNFYDWTVDTTLSLSSEVYLSINDEAIPMSLQLYSDISRYCAHESTKMLVFKRHCQRLCWDPSLMFMEIKELRAVVTALDREQSRKEMKLREKRGRGVANFRTFDVSPNRSPVDTDKKSTSPFAFDPLSGSESQFSSVPVSALEGTVNVEGGVIRLSVLLGDDEKASLEIFNPRIELHRKFMAEDDCVVRTLKMTARGSQDMPQEAVTLYKVQPEYSRRLPLVSVPPFDMGHHTREPDFSLSSSSSSSTFLGANVIQSELKASLGDSHLVVEIDPKMFKEILQDIRTFVKGKDATKLSAPVLAAPPLEFEQSGLLDQRSRMVEAFSLLSSLEGDDCSSMAVSADEVYWVGSLQRIAGLLHMLRVEQCRQNRNQTEKKDQNVNFDRNSKRKIIDKMTHVFDFNPIFSVHKGNGSGMSLNVLLRWFGVEGEDFVVIPEGIHTYLTANLDGLLEAATQASHSTDLWFRKP